MKSIAIIMPFFGEWPKWKDLFFDSCASNYDVDFFFYTDCGDPGVVSSNIHLIEISFSKYCEWVSSRLEIDFTPHSPKKLCDLKPFYGYIHQDVLKDYDFWGFGDVDLVFGNIRKFYNEELLQRYDVLSTHFDRLSGHFAIIRNNEYYRNLCFKMRNWKRYLMMDVNCILDESEFSYTIYPEIRLPRLLYAKIWKYWGWDVANPFHVRFVRVINKWTNIEKRRVRYVEMNVHPNWTGSEKWIYTSGKMSENGKCRLLDAGVKEECIYCHFLPYKDSFPWKKNVFEIIPEVGRILITSSGIVMEE